MLKFLLVIASMILVIFMGSQVFSHRELTYPFNIYATGENAKVLMNNKKNTSIKLVNELNGKTKTL